jgi:uncharacterized protein (DUF1697 family)
MSNTTKYVAFLRGINVGKIRIKMADLKSAFEIMEFANVTTFLQTGNVTFESAESIPAIKTTLEKGLSQAFNYNAYVLIYPFSVLNKITQNYPMERVETHHAYIVFVETAAIFEELKTIALDMDQSRDGIAAGNNILYWRVERGASTDTLFSKILAKAKYKSTTTVRNINTLELMV